MLDLVDDDKMKEDFSKTFKFETENGTLTLQLNKSMDSWKNNDVKGHLNLDSKIDFTNGTTELRICLELAPKGDFYRQRR